MILHYSAVCCLLLHYMSLVLGFSLFYPGPIMTLACWHVTCPCRISYLVLELFGSVGVVRIFLKSLKSINRAEICIGNSF